jgi:hypothetical protein
VAKRNKGGHRGRELPILILLRLIVVRAMRAIGSSVEEAQRRNVRAGSEQQACGTGGKWIPQCSRSARTKETGEPTHTGDWRDNEAGTETEGSAHGGRETQYLRLSPSLPPFPFPVRRAALPPMEEDVELVASRRQSHPKSKEARSAFAFSATPTQGMLGSASLAADALRGRMLTCGCSCPSAPFAVG